MIALHTKFRSRIHALMATAVLTAAVPVLAQEPPAGGEAPEKAVDLPQGTSATGSLLDEMDSGSAAASTTSAQTTWDLPSAPPAPTYPYVEYHGYFRFRPDLISNGHLGQFAESQTTPGRPITTSAVLPPLSLWPNNNNPSYAFADQVGAKANETMLAGANMRIRIAPTIHLSDTIRIVTTLDILDNYVLGSTPDYAGSSQRPDVPLVAFTTSTRPGAIAVKEAYGEWKTLLGVLRFGRQASNWGLGIFANGGAGDGWDGGRPTEYYGGARLPHEGSGYDADFASYADRVAFVTKLGPLYVSLFYDFASQGLTAIDSTRPDGQARDMEESDDVKQGGFAILSKPLSPAEIEARKTALLDNHEAVVDWGIYGLYRSQKNDLASSYAASDLTLQNVIQNNVNGKPDKMQLIPRGASAWAFDAWGRFEKRISFSRRLVVEAEATTLFGHIDDANVIGGQAAKSRDILMWGGALKSAFQNEGIGIYFDAGVASGDDTGCFGVYPVAGNSGCGLAKANGDVNTDITAFKFHKNYRVDNLLFRELVGSVTNAVYFKPTFSINAYPFYSPQQLGLDVSVLKALALDPKGTPGGDSDIGWEFDARGFLGQKGLFLAQVTFAYAVTGHAFDLKQGWYGAVLTNGATVQVPENAWRILGHVSLMF